MYYIKILLFLGLALLASSVKGKDSVPVLLWDSQKIQRNLPAVSALQIISYDSFRDKYLNSFQPKNILLFLQDTLSVEDLSSHPDELKQISKQMETSHSLYLPAVEDASSLEHKLASHGYTVTVVDSGSSMAGLSLKKGEKNLVVVNLPSTITNPSRKNALQKTDEVIANVLSKIGKKAPFTVIFTGKKPSVESSNLPHVRRSRSTKTSKASNETGPAFFYQCKCVMLYLRDKIMIYKDGQHAYDLVKASERVHCEDCTDTKATINLNYINVGTYNKVKVSFTFEIKGIGRYWALTEGDIYEQDYSQITANLFPSKAMYTVPVTKAYTCGQTHTLYSNSTTVKYKMVLPSLQVQAFFSDQHQNQEKFGPSWDCLGFFTIPIWMGLLTGGLLLFILMFGLYMVSSVKTMDRFDDPKAKHFMMVSSVAD